MIWSPNNKTSVNFEIELFWTYLFALKCQNSCSVKDVLCSVCGIAGYLSSYWNCTLLPERCRNAAFDDKITYNTMIRSAGSWTQLGQVVMMLMNNFSWRHVVVLSDKNSSVSICIYGATSITSQLPETNYAVISIQLNNLPSSIDIAYILDTVYQRARGEYLTVLTDFSWPSECLGLKVKQVIWGYSLLTRVSRVGHTHMWFNLATFSYYGSTDPTLVI
jgi:Receptor family ligand binding region